MTFVITYFLPDRTIGMFPTYFSSKEEAESYIEACHAEGEHLDKELCVMEA